MAETPRLDLPYIAASQYQKEVTHNLGLDRLDLLVQCAVLDRNLTAPPASPAEGDAYIVGPAPTGAWADHANALALWISSQWQLIPPQPGWLCFVIDETVLVYWSGTTWTIASAGSGSATTLLGLTDVPDTYSGQAGKTLVVNPGETAVEFGTLAGSAPVDAPYVVTAIHAGLSAERVVTDTTQIAWDTATAGQLKATIAPAGVSLDTLAHQPPGTLLGRGDTLAPTDEVQALTVGPGLTLSGTTLSATGSATDFLALTDTPDAYTGQAGKAVIVNPGATALEFGTAGAGDFLALTDTPDAYTGQEGKTVAVKADATGLEFVVGGGTSAALGAQVQRVSTQSIAASTNVTISFDTELRDDAGYFTLSAPTRFTIPTTGWYSITAFVQWDSTASGQRILNVRVNGTQYIAVDTVATAGTDHRQTIAVNWYLAAADYVEVVVFQNTAGARTLTGLATLVGMTAAPATATTFLALTDTPDSYSGQAGKLVQVNAGATALEFSTALSGTPLSVVRYTAAGTALEASPLTVTASGLVGLGTATPGNALHLVGETIQATTFQQDLYLTSASGPSQTARHARGTLAAPARVVANDVLLGLQGQGWARDLADTTDTWFLGGRLQFLTDTVDAQGRIGGRLALHLAPGAGQPVTEVVRVTQEGNLLLGTTTHGTSLTRGVVLASGTAPTTSPADAVQLWTADRAGTAGQAGLHLRTEDGTSHVFGDRVGLGTATPETATFTTLSAPLGGLPLTVLASTVGVSGRSALVSLVRRSTGDMLDTFGPALAFQIADTAAVDNQIALVVARRQGADNSGRLLLLTANTGVVASNTAPGELAVDPLGNVSLNIDVWAHGGQRVFALGEGTAPTTSPADAVQLWSANRGGVAGKNSLHLRTEDGTSHVLGDLSGLGTTLTATLGSGASYQTLSVKGGTLFVNQSSVQERPQALIAPSFVVSTDATRTSRLTLSVYDASAAREGVRLETSGTAAMLGFYGSAAVAKPTVTGAKGGNAALASVLTALASLGLVTDSSTA